jgi:hypothetical protein
LFQVNLGPLDYNPKPIHLKKAPAVIIQNRPTAAVKEMTKPAPNKYFPELEQSKKIATLKGRYKTPPPLMETPGPANYIIPNNTYYGVQVGLAPRPIEPLLSYNAGPTSYDPVYQHVTQPKFSLGKQIYIKRSKRGSKMPSPASYTVTDRQIRTNNAPKCSLKSRRVNTSDSGEQSSPGPADYIPLPRYTATVSQRARNEIIMRESLRPLLETKKDLKPCTPGPSDYDVGKARAPREGFSLGRRIDKLKNDEKPSPGTYNVRSDRKNTAIRMKGRNSPFVLVFPSTRFDTLRI